MNNIHCGKARKRENVTSRDLDFFELRQAVTRAWLAYYNLCTMSEGSRCPRVRPIARALRRAQRLQLLEDEMALARGYTVTPYCDIDHRT